MLPKRKAKFKLTKEFIKYIQVMFQLAVFIWFIYFFCPQPFKPS